MASPLRQLLLQRAARLQGRSALTAPGWGTLSWSAWRNRVEGVAFGLLSEDPSPSSVAPRGDSPWTWALEVAAACAGIPLDQRARDCDPAIFGGARFNSQEGRHAFHECEDTLSDATPFDARLTHGDLILRLQRWNRKLGWDHATAVQVPMDALPTPPGRAVLWNLLYAGGHAVLVKDAPTERGGLARLLRRKPDGPTWDPSPFTAFWD